MKQNNKKIVVLPGAIWQVPIVKKIREMGCESIVISPADDSPTFPLADKVIQSDIFAKDNYLDIIRELNVDAVISEQCDIATQLVAELAEELNVPSQGTKVAELYASKVRMREFLQEHNLPFPAYKLCYTVQEAIEFYRSLNRKMIIKPINSSSSHGVFTINEEVDLVNHFEEAKSFSRGEKAVICEQYISGTEFTVDGIKTPQGHKSLIISEKKHYAHNENIAYELFFSHDNPKFNYDQLRQTNDNFVNLSGLPFGLTHAEYKYENGEFYLIEIGARGGGNLISNLIVPCMSGYDNYEALIKMALGDSNIKEPTIEPKLLNRCAVLEFFDAPSNGGVVTAIEGEDFLKTNPNILAYKLNFTIGDTIRPAVCDTARIGFYIAYANSRSELNNLMDEIKNTVKFII
ncbi:MAG: ATP-grasp domain-containing protein [Paludibacteraceae bacterium]|nr:ATP-grasp domain-containing protein [Paludibacteraceae bacterium]